MHERQVFQAIEQLRFLYERGHLTAELFERKRKELMAQLEMTPLFATDSKDTEQQNEPQRTPLSSSRLITRDFNTPSKIPQERLHHLVDGSPVAPSNPVLRVAPEPTTSEDLGELRELQVGDLVRGRYRLEKLLGTGGMGQVFLAEDLRFVGRYALKVLHPWVVKHEPTISRFVQEFKIMERLNHPGIVRTYLLDEDTAHDSLFFLMEYVNGETLQQVLDAALAKKGIPPFSAEETLQFLEKLVSILRYTHGRRILHRDLKPTNIMFLREPGKDISLKLLDFGLAKHLTGTSDQALHTGQAGTFFYIAPEQLLGGETATVAADIFSIGVILYQMLTGSLPVAMATPPSEINPSLPKQADHVLRQAMDAHWQKRYQNVDELLEAFAQSLRSPTKAPGSPLSESQQPFGSLASSSASSPSTERYHSANSSREKTNTSGSTSVDRLQSSSSGNLSEDSRGTFFPRPSSSTPSVLPNMPNKETIGRSGNAAISNADRIARLRSGPLPRKPEAANSPPVGSSKPPYLHAFPAHDRKITKLLLNPDGSFLISLSQDRTVKLWESHSWFPLHTLQTPRHGCLDLLWKNNGSQLIFLDPSGQIELWDVLRLEVQSRLRIQTTPRCMVMTGDERFLYIGCEDGTMQIWDLEQQRHDKTLPGHTAPLLFLRNLPEHNLLISCDAQGSILVRDTRNLTRFSQLQQASPRITAIGTSPKKTIIVVGTEEGQLSVWDVQQRRQIHTWSHQRSITDIQWSPHGNWLASSSMDGHIKLWRTEESEMLHDIVDPQGSIYTIAIAKDGKWLASAGQDHMIKIWDTSIWGL